jgi:hypothetical protein
MAKGGRKKSQHVYRYWVGQHFEYFDPEKHTTIKGKITKVDSLPDEVNDRIFVETEEGGEDMVQIPRSNRTDSQWPGGRKKSPNEGSPVKKVQIVADKTLGSTVTFLDENDHPMLENYRIVDFKFSASGQMEMKIVDVMRAAMAAPIADQDPPKTSS